MVEDIQSRAFTMYAEAKRVSLKRTEDRVNTGLDRVRAVPTPCQQYNNGFKTVDWPAVNQSSFAEMCEMCGGIRIIPLFLRSCFVRATTS